MESNNCSIRITDCSNWRNYQKKIISDQDECVDSCSNTSYPYEYLGKCYDNCPIGTSYKHNNICYECDSDCKECYFDDSSNCICISCKDSNKFLNNEKCVSSCDYGFYIDNSNKICCTLEKCSQCSKESLDQNFCTACNNGYFPKYNDILNQKESFDCYQNLNGYYLFELNSNYYFKECYSTCQNCITGGTSEFHNCETCKVNFKLEVEFNSYKNCYEECDNYYYLDKENNLFCTGSLECPEEYNILIEEKKQCVIGCDPNSKYKYEFRKQCLEECPEGSEESETKKYFCEIICEKNSPFELISNQTCVSFCSIKDWAKRLCKPKNEDEEANTDLILENILTDLSNQKYDFFPLNENKKVVITEKLATFALTTTYNNEDNDINSIIECENKLKDYYEIPMDNHLYILIISVYKKEMTDSKIGYEVYYPLKSDKLEKLDLGICNNSLNDNEISKCSKYSIKSFLDDYCLSCFPPYHQIQNDNSNKNPFVKCYKNPKG